LRAHDLQALVDLVHYLLFDGDLLFGLGHGAPFVGHDSSLGLSRICAGQRRKISIRADSDDLTDRYDGDGEGGASPRRRASGSRASLGRRLRVRRPGRSAHPFTRPGGSTGGRY
jgi:hypothetical protein